MAPDVGVASRKSVGRNGASSRLSLKKGPWTAAEDAILMEYVKKHGEGNWNAVQRNSGLMRCGKSCRLRWANHLRPNLKKGAFSSQEEALIVELHAKLGNKWARMAAQLPGRTDNEIKNYWNTRLKRRQRAGLPIYTHDVNVKAQIFNQHENNHQANHLSSSSLGIFLSSPPPPPTLSPGYITPLSLFDAFNTSSTTLKPTRQQPKTSYLANSIQHLKYFEEKNGGLTFPPSSSGLFQYFHNQENQNSLTLPSIQYNCVNFGSDSTPISGVSFEQNGVVSREGDVELPSIQSFVPKTTPSSPTSMEYMIRMSSDGAEYDETNRGFSRGNSGLLGDLIDESKSLTSAKKSKQDFLVVDDKTQDNYLWDYNLTQDKQIEDSASPPHSSIGVKTINASSKETNSMDDDFLNLLDDFPLTNFRENQQESSNSVVATSVKTNGNFDVGSCNWKNMPRISQM